MASAKTLNTLFLILESWTKTGAVQYGSWIEAEGPEMKTITLRFGLRIHLGSTVDAAGGRIDVNGPLESALFAVSFLHDQPPCRCICEILFNIRHPYMNVNGKL